MTERKPSSISWESWIDVQIRLGREQGAFDDLPGTGKPLAGIDQPRDELWWLKDKLRREGVDHLPTTLRLRKEVQAARAEIRTAPTEERVREVVEQINERIRWVNSHACDGPPSTSVCLDLDDELARWRSGSGGPSQ